jgi:hypothetical protein
MSFIEFLRGLAGTAAAQRGFLREALTDRNFPGIQNFDQLNVYLIMRRASVEMREEAYRHWGEYHASRSKP